MKTFFLLLFFTFLTSTFFAQKIKFKDDKVTVDGVEYLKWNKQGNSDFSISALNVENEEIFVRWMSYKDPNQITKSNPEGYVRWIELNFLVMDVKCEIGGQSKKSLIKVLIANKLYVDGSFNPDNASLMVKKFGTNFSQNRPNGNVNIIINN